MKAPKPRLLLPEIVWVPVPFYLVGADDPKGQRKILEFFNSRLSLNLDFRTIDSEVDIQNEKLARLRKDMPDCDRTMAKLESNERLTEQEHEALMKQVEDYLTEKK